MKKSILTIGLFTLVMILTSFTTPETITKVETNTSVDMLGQSANGGNKKVDMLGQSANGGNKKVDMLGQSANGGNKKVD